MVDSGGYILADGEWWCVVVDGGGDSDGSSDKDVLENILIKKNFEAEDSSEEDSIKENSDEKFFFLHK